MAITRVGLIAIPDPAKQDQAVAGFSSFSTECKKDGQPYLLGSKASKVQTIVDQPGSQAWTVIYELTFASQEDMEYYQTQDPVVQAMLKQASDGSATGFIVVASQS